MNPCVRARIAALGLVALLASLAPAMAQTTGTLSGRITERSGAVLPGVTIVATHTPTGTSYETTSDGEGNFAIPNVRVGGPYAVSAQLAGFRNAQRDDVFVQLGTEATVPFQLDLATVTEAVTVTAEVNPIINPGRTGSESTISREVVQTLPTVSRNINDLARTNPNFQTDAGRGGLVIAGKNYRYNAVQIDGAVTSDLFGLSNTGAPGGSAGVTPIALDSVDEIQLVVAPYDVRLGGFTGGGINAVTRGGTNLFTGSAYYYFRNQDLVGDGPLETPLAPFNNKVAGASVGGPIVRDRAFFFGNYERNMRNSPSGYAADGSSGVNFGHVAEIERIRNVLISRYGFDPGGLGEVNYARNSDKIFARFDMNVSRQHRLTVRHSWVDGRDEQFGSHNGVTYSLPNTLYGVTNTTNSTVGQLNSTFGTKWYNELRLVYTRIRDFRDVPQRFPTVQVFLPDNTNIFAGTERSSHANSLDQDSVEITNDFTFFAGSHTITVGTHNELFNFSNLFTGQLYGEYQFSSVEQFEAGLAQGYLRNFSRTADPLERADFGVKQWGFYVGDQWRAKSNLTFTLGARVDLPRFDDTPLENPFTLATFGYATNVKPSPTQFSPRLGFNWDVNKDGSSQVRGGVGVFTGRTPYVWLSNNYIGTGIQFAQLQVTRNNVNNIPFNPDPDNQPIQIGSTSGTASNQFAMVDPDFKFPSLLRYTLGYDRKLNFGGLVASAEFLYADTLQEILYKNVNLALSGATAFDGRPRYQRIDQGTSAAYLLTNTTEGTSWTISTKLERPFQNGFFASGSYLYNDTTSVNDGTSSTAASQFGNNPVPGDPNEPPTTLSNYATGHRVNLAFSYNRPFIAGSSTTVSLYYNGQSGLPFKYVFATGNINDINGDQSVGTAGGVNDLLYIPASASEVVINNGTWDELNAYIEANGLGEYRGRTVERNAFRLDWRNNVDLRWAVDLPTGGRTKVELALDIQNFLNMFDKDSGRVDEEIFPGLAPISYTGQVNGLPAYTLLFKNANFTRTTYSDLASRWQAQLGARFRF